MTCPFYSRLSDPQRIMFWGVSDDLYNVDQLCEDAQKCIKRAQDRDAPESDLALLYMSFDHMLVLSYFTQCTVLTCRSARAESDRLWRAMNAHEDTPYRVFGIPRTIFDAWTRAELKSAQSDACNISQDSLSMVFMAPDRLIKLREMVIGRPLMSTTSLIQGGIDVEEKDRQWRQWYLQKQQVLKKNRHKDSEGHKGNTIVDSVRKTVAPDKMKEVQKELFVAQERLKALAEEEEDNLSSTTVQSTPANQPSRTADDDVKAMLLTSSPIAGVQVGRSASSKLNHILNDVCGCLIFPLSCTHLVF